MSERRRWLIWSLCVLVWTAALVTPYPVHAGRAVLPAGSHFPIAKLLHIGAYAFLTVLSAWLGVRDGRRWWLLVFLSLHGMGTEFVQQWVPERSGSVSDVLIDHVGIALGFALSWPWWLRPAGPEA